MVLKLFWSGVIGLAVGIEVLAVLLIPMGVLVAHGKYGDFEQYKTHKGQATRTAIYGFLGLSKGTGRFVRASSRFWINPTAAWLASEGRVS